jgi:branched-chain amino acid transport system permease protein
VAAILISRTSQFTIDTATTVLIYGTAALGVSVVYRDAHLLDAGHGIYFAAGGYTALLFAQRSPGLPVVVGILAGITVAAALGALLGFVISGLPALYFTLATMAATFVVTAMLTGFAVFGASSGMGAAARGLFGAQDDLSLLQVFWVCVVAFCLSSVVLGHFRGSRFVRLARSAEPGSRIPVVVGYSGRSVRVKMMCLSGAVTGLAGGLYGLSVQFIDPSIASVQTSLILLTIVVLAGGGVRWSVLVSSAVLVGAPIYLPGGSSWGTVLTGAILAGALLVQHFHLGVVQWVGGVRDVARRWLSSSMPDNGPQGNRANLVESGVTEDADSDANVGDLPEDRRNIDVDAVGGVLSSRRWLSREARSTPALVATSISVAYDGVLAVSDVTLIVYGGEVVGLIGPNGAGKSSLLGAISGLVPLSGGSVEVVGKGGNRPARHGGRVSRTFQAPQLTGDLTISENIAVGCASWSSPTMWRGLVPLRAFDPLRREESQAVDAVLQVLRLEEFRHDYPLSVPVGVLRLAEVARCVVTGAPVLLLDEPTAGLGTTEKKSLVGAINICKELGMGIVLVEHDMALICEVADKVNVLAAGMLISSGTVDEVWADPAVADVYLEVAPRQASGVAGGIEAGTANR